MSRKGNVLGNRLGISKNWKTHISANKELDLLSKSYFIKKHSLHYLDSVPFLWVLDTCLVKRKNRLDLHVLICTPWKKRLMVKDLYFIQKGKRQKYFWPWFMRILTIPNSPVSSLYAPQVKISEAFFEKLGKSGRSMSLRKSIQMSDARYLASKTISQYWRRYILTYLQKVYLEYNLSRIIDTSVNVHLYNLVDLVRLATNANVFQTIILKSLYFLPKEQRRYGASIKGYMIYLNLGVMLQNSTLIGNIFSATLRKTRGFVPFMYFWMLYLEEFFYRISQKPSPEFMVRATHLKIQVSGKIGSQMRAVKQVFHFSNVVARDIPSQTLSKPIDYSLTEVITRKGVLGFKIWIY